MIIYKYGSICKNVNVNVLQKIEKMSRTKEQAGPSKPSGSAGSAGEKEEKEKDDRMFECNICLDTAKDAVVSMCGHLFW